MALCRPVPPGTILSSDLEVFREQLHHGDDKPHEKVCSVLDHWVAAWAVAEGLRGDSIDLPKMIANSSKIRHVLHHLIKQCQMRLI